MTDTPTNAPVSEAMESRFVAKVDRRGPDECWPWLSGCDGNGYGSLSIGGKHTRATHISLILDGRSRPSKQHFACHRCDNPICVNPGHLWWGTQSENMRDAYAKGRVGGPRHTHCPQGHEYAGDNVYINTNGWRECFTCKREQGRKHMRDHRERQKAAAAVAQASAARANEIVAMLLTRLTASADPTETFIYKSELCGLKETLAAISAQSPDQGARG